MLLHADIEVQNVQGGWWSLAVSDETGADVIAGILGRLAIAQRFDHFQNGNALVFAQVVQFLQDFVLLFATTCAKDVQEETVLSFAISARPEVDKTVLDQRADGDQ